MCIKGSIRSCISHLLVRNLMNIRATLVMTAGMIRVILLSILLFYACEYSYTQYYGSRFNDRGISFCQNERYFYLAGTTSSFSAGEDPDIYVIRADENGDEIWSGTYGGTDSDYGNCGKFLSDDNIAILGSSRSGDSEDLDIFFLKLSASGEIIKGLDREFVIPFSLPIIYPNPTHTYINIFVKDYIQDQPIEFILYDVSGKLIKQMEYSGRLNTINFDPQLSRGIYIYRIKTNETIHTGKIVIN